MTTSETEANEERKSMTSTLQDDLPELVPRDDPGRLAWEAELRARGYTPAKVWNWPDHKVFKKPGWRERLVDGARRVWYGPVPEPLTDEELETVMRPREDGDIPELVPPDDPDRLAWEAELRSRGIRPAKKWNFPVRAPIRKPSFWKRIMYRVSLGW